MKNADIAETEAFKDAERQLRAMYRKLNAMRLTYSSRKSLHDIAHGHASMSDFVEWHQQRLKDPESLKYLRLYKDTVALDATLSELVGRNNVAAEDLSALIKATAMVAEKNKKEHKMKKDIKTKSKESKPLKTKADQKLKIEATKTKSIKAEYPENKEFCARCERTLNKMRIVWLEYDQKAGTYHTKLPEGRVSQGFHPFGVACSRAQLKETREKMAQKKDIFNQK